MKELSMFFAGAIFVIITIIFMALRLNEVYYQISGILGITLVVTGFLMVKNGNNKDNEG
jgi:membrane-bound ClpP family serine protease